MVIREEWPPKVEIIPFKDKIGNVSSLDIIYIYYIMHEEYNI